MPEPGAEEITITTNPADTEAPLATALLGLIQLAYTHADFRLRKAALALIPQLQDEEQILALLTDAISDPHHEVRALVIQTVLELGIKPPRAILNAAFSDEEDNNRKLAIELITRLALAERAAWLDQILNGSDRALKTVLLLSLQKLTNSEQANIIDRTSDLTLTDKGYRQALIQGIAQASMSSIQCNRVLANLLAINLTDTDLLTLLDECSNLPAKQCSQLIGKSLEQAKQLATRFKAAQVLGALAKREPELAKPLFLNLLKDKDLNVSLSKDSLLSLPSEKIHSNFLDSVMREKEESMSWAVSQGVDTLPPLIAVPLIKKILREHPDANLRSTTAANLGDLPWQTAVPLIELALHDPDERVRLAAIKQTTALPAVQALALLAIAFQDKGPNVREAAVAALGKNYLSVHQSLFYRALHDEAANVRAKAASFYHLFSPEFIERDLPKTLNDPNRLVVIEASKNISRLPEPLKQQFLAQYKSVDHSAIRTGIAASLAALPWEEATNFISLYLLDAQTDVRVAVINSLGELIKQTGSNQDQALNYLKQSLRNTEPGILMATVQAAAALPLAVKTSLLLPFFNLENFPLGLAILASLKAKANQ